MTQNDYIIRVIEQLAAFLWAIVFRKNMNQLDEALVELNEAWEGFPDIDRGKIAELDAEAILALYTEKGKLDKGAIEVAASLLYEEADIGELKNGANPFSQDMFQKAFLLFHALNAAESSKKYREKLGALCEKLRYDFMKPAVLRVLCSFGENNAYYAKAEDCYYGLMEAGEKEARDGCIHFYRRLLAHTDDELKEGGLPRQEILEGLQKLEQRDT